MTADDVIRLLHLQPHPVEGGYFRETYRAAATISPPTAVARASPRRSTTCSSRGTSRNCTRLPSDEVFHFYLGAPVRMLQLWPDGSGREVVLGADLAAGQVPQLVVPAGVWQGTRLWS